MDIYVFNLCPFAPGSVAIFNPENTNVQHCKQNTVHHPEKSPDKTFLLWFPEFNPASLQTKAPHGTLFIDPGLATEPCAHLWRPDTLPLDADTARTFLRESDGFVREHGRGRQSLAAAALTREDFYAQTSLAIRSRLTSPAESRKSHQDPAVQAQQVLLLAWRMEQHTQEIQALQQSIRAGWDDLAQTLGMDESDDMPSLAGEKDFLEDDPQSLPWPMILESVMYFAPPGAVLATNHRAVLEELAEIESCAPEACAGPQYSHVQSLLAGNKGRLVRALGWRLAGRTRCPVHKPWLAAPREVLLLGSPDALQEY